MVKQNTQHKICERMTRFVAYVKGMVMQNYRYDFSAFRSMPKAFTCNVYTIELACTTSKHVGLQEGSQDKHIVWSNKTPCGLLWSHQAKRHLILIRPMIGLFQQMLLMRNVRLYRQLTRFTYFLGLYSSTEHAVSMESINYRANRGGTTYEITKKPSD